MWSKPFLQCLRDLQRGSGGPMGLVILHPGFDQQKLRELDRLKLALNGKYSAVCNKETTKKECLEVISEMVTILEILVVRLNEGELTEDMLCLD